jgi:hypothetical protein
MRTSHVVIASLFGIGFIGVIRHLSRRGLLSIRYTLGWLLIGALALLYPLLLVVSREVSDFIHVQPAAILLGLPLIIVGLVCIQLSISVSGLIEQVRTLIETVAILRSRLDSEQPTRTDDRAEP